MQPHRQPAQPVIQRFPGAAAHDVDLGVRADGELAKQRQQGGVGPGQLGRGRERHEGAVVVEQQQEAFGLLEPSAQLRPRGVGPAHRRAAARRPRRGGELVEKARDPAMHVERVHPGSQRRQPGPALVRLHRQRAVEHLGGAVGVVGIHLERLGQLPAGTRELAQHQHAVAVGAGGDELLGHEVHPVAERRHHHHVGGAVERHQVRRRDPAEDVVHRHPARRAVRTVDPSHQAVHQGAEVLVRLDPGARGHRHLHQPHLPPQLRMGLEHPLVGQQAPGNPLGVVQPVHPDEEPHAAVAAERLGFGLDGGIPAHLAEERGVHPHREYPEPHLAPGQLHPVDIHRVAEDIGERGGEVAEIGRGVEADQVGAEEPLEEAGPGREGAEQLLAGKRDVQEEPDPGIRDHPPEEPGDQQELVVVHPDHVPGPVVAGHRPGELLVGLHVGVPVGDVERDLIEEVVEEGPEHPVGEPLVVAGHLLGGERDGDEAQRGELFPEGVVLLRGQVLGGPGPADPESVRLLVGALEPGGQPSGAPLHLDGTIADLDGDGEAVGDDQEAGH
jgi:hypothetical protein